MLRGSGIVTVQNFENVIEIDIKFWCFQKAAEL